jgi:hypothetical protein
MVVHKAIRVGSGVWGPEGGRDSWLKWNRRGVAVVRAEVRAEDTGGAYRQ